MGKIKIVTDLTGCGKRVDHIGDGADAVERIEAVHRLRAVRHTDGDVVALADAECEIGLGRLVDAADKFRIGRLFAHEFIGVVFGEFFCGLAHHAVEAFLRIGQVMRGIAIILEPRRRGRNAHICHPFCFYRYTPSGGPLRNALRNSGSHTPPEYRV